MLLLVVQPVAGHIFLFANTGEFGWAVRPLVLCLPKTKQAHFAIFLSYFLLSISKVRMHLSVQAARPCLKRARFATPLHSPRLLSTLTPASASRFIDIHPEVAQARAEGRAIVALESTLITHGQQLSRPPQATNKLTRHFVQVFHHHTLLISLSNVKRSFGLRELHQRPSLS